MHSPKSRLPAKSVFLLAPFLFGAAAAQTPAATGVARKPFFVLTETERQTGRDHAQRDARVAKLLGPGPVITAPSDVIADKNEAMALLSGRSTKPPARYIDVTVLNRQTGRAAIARVRLGDGQVVSVGPVETSAVPLFREEVEAGYEAMRADKNVNGAVSVPLDRFHLRLPGDAAAAEQAEVLPLRSSAPSDPCYAHRCMEFLLRNQSGYLPLRVMVDVTAHSVVIERHARSTGGMKP